MFDNVSDSSECECADSDKDENDVRNDVKFLGEIPISAVKANGWVVVTHKREKWLGKVLEKCLTKFDFNVSKITNHISIIAQKFESLHEAM